MGKEYIRKGVKKERTTYVDYLNSIEMNEGEDRESFMVAPMYLSINMVNVKERLDLSTLLEKVEVDPKPILVEGNDHIQMVKLEKLVQHVDMVNAKPKAKDLGGNLRVAPPLLFLNKPSLDDKEVTDNFDTGFDVDDLKAIPLTMYQRFILSNAIGRVEVVKGDDSSCYYQ